MLYTLSIPLNDSGKVYALQEFLAPVLDEGPILLQL